MRAHQTWLLLRREEEERFKNCWQPVDPCFFIQWRICTNFIYPSKSLHTVQGNKIFTSSSENVIHSKWYHYIPSKIQFKINLKIDDLQNFNSTENLRKINRSNEKAQQTSGGKEKRKTYCSRLSPNNKKIRLFNSINNSMFPFSFLENF